MRHWKNIMCPFYTWCQSRKPTGNGPAPSSNCDYWLVSVPIKLLLFAVATIKSHLTCYHKSEFKISFPLYSDIFCVRSAVWTNFFTLYGSFNQCFEYDFKNLNLDLYPAPRFCLLRYGLHLLLDLKTCKQTKFGLKDFLPLCLCLPMKFFGRK